MATFTNVVEIIVKGTAAEPGGTLKNIFNVFHYALGPSGAAASALAVGNAFVAQVWPNIAPALSIGYKASEVDARLLDDPTNPAVVCTKQADGATAGDWLPPHNAVTIILKANLRGRNYRGSKHFSPVAESDTTADEINAAALAKWQAVRDTLGAALSPSGAGQYFPVILSRTKSQLVKAPVTIDAANFSQQLLNLTIGTMRRRKEKTKR